MDTTTKAARLENAEELIRLLASLPEHERRVISESIQMTAICVRARETDKQPA